MTKRRQFTAKFKFQLALETLKGMQTVNLPTSPVSSNYKFEIGIENTD